MIRFVICKKMFRFLAVVARMSEMETDKGKLHVVSPVRTTSPVGKLRFSPEKTKGYMSGMSTLLSPFVAAMSPVPPLLKC